MGKVIKVIKVNPRKNSPEHTLFLESNLTWVWIMKSVVYKSLEKILKDLLSSSFFSEWYTIPFQNLSNVND